MAKKTNGNGDPGGDLIVGLHSAVVDLRQALARQHQETDQHIGRIARMLGAVGDRLSDHERRLAKVEAKVG